MDAIKVISLTFYMKPICISHLQIDCLMLDLELMSQENKGFESDQVFVNLLFDIVSRIRDMSVQHSQIIPNNGDLPWLKKNS